MNKAGSSHRHEQWHQRFFLKAVLFFVLVHWPLDVEDDILHIKSGDKSYRPCTILKASIRLGRYLLFSKETRFLFFLQKLIIRQTGQASNHSSSLHLYICDKVDVLLFVWWPSLDIRTCYYYPKDAVRLIHYSHHVGIPVKSLYMKLDFVEMVLPKHRSKIWNFKNIFSSDNKFMEWQ